MKQFWQISARHLTIGMLATLVVSGMLVIAAQYTDWWIFKILLFACLVFLPGVALMRSIRIPLVPFSASILYSFGLGILLLMIGGLLANQILFAAGVTRPLEAPGVFAVWSTLTLLLIMLGAKRNRQPVRIKKRDRLWPNKPTLVLLGLGALLPAGAAIGAFQLNNGGGAIAAELTLAFAALLIVYATWARRHLSHEVLAWFVFLVAFTVLLMTSLRGWDIVGHDIEREFRVYTLAHLSAHWDIAAYRDPYNACLSITILPEVFGRLLNIPGIIVFKVVLQIIFAVCVAVVYTLLRRHASKLGALIGSLLFICYPTFINDSAMLTRQGVAYLFFALAILVLSNRVQKVQYKILFLLCSMGAILSHYSTAYMFVALFVAAVLCKYLGMGWHRLRGQPYLHGTLRTVLTPFFAVMLFCMTFMWYTQITATSGGLGATLSASLANIPKLFTDENRSSDTSTALLFAGGKTQAELYDLYLTHSSAPNTESLMVPTLTSDVLPLTPLGKKAQSVGIDPSLITVLRQNFAKALQVLALASVVYVAYRLVRRRHSTLSPDFTYLSLAAIALLALLVVLPFLSVNYGLLRAFQQALIFLVLPIVLLLAHIGRYFHSRLRVALAAASIVMIFLLFTGMFAQLLGGVSPSLSMNNQGLYYGLYHTGPADQQSFQWIKNHIPKHADVRAANFNRALMYNPQYPFTRAGILPAQITPTSFVYLDSAQVQTQRFYTYYESSPLIMTFPMDYYDWTKNQIYSTTSTRIYR